MLASLQHWITAHFQWNVGRIRGRFNICYRFQCKRKRFAPMLFPWTPLPQVGWVRAREFWRLGPLASRWGGYRGRGDYGTGNVPPGNGLRDPTQAPLERQLGYPNSPQTASLSPASGVGLAETAQSWAPITRKCMGGGHPNYHFTISILSKTCQVIKLTKLTPFLLALTKHTWPVPSHYCFNDLVSRTHYQAKPPAGPVPRGPIMPLPTQSLIL